MNRRKEVPRAKNRERQRIKQAGGGKEIASMLLRAPTVLLDDEGETYSVIAQRKPPSPRFICCKCNKGTAGQPYQFGGSLACEQCVTNYYRSRSQDLSDVILKAEFKRRLAEELAVELPCRARQGDRILRDLERRRRRDSF